MKSKRTTVLLTVVLGLLLGREALAFYNPSSGRWLSRDPIGEEGGRNLYALVENQPVTQIDTDGRERGAICSKCGRYYVGLR